MGVSIEDILLAKAQADQQDKVDPAVAMGLGGAGGAAIGATLGQGVHQVGKGINAMRGRTANPFKPGHRMAGGLVGMILGGGLGEGMRQQMVTGSPAGAMLAKLQASGGNLNEADQLELQRVLTDIYGGL